MTCLPTHRSVVGHRSKFTTANQFMSIVLHKKYFFLLQKDPVNLPIRQLILQWLLRVREQSQRGSLAAVICDLWRLHTASVGCLMQQLLRSFCAEISASKDSWDANVHSHLEEGSCFAHEPVKKTWAESPQAASHS